MPLKTFFKASSITNLSDARYFAAFPADWMSFHCNPVSSKYVPHSQIKEMIGWLQGPDYCLEVAGLDHAVIAKLLQELKVEGLEVEPVQRLSEELLNDYTIFRRLMVTKASTKKDIQELGRQLLDETDIFILDFQLNGLSFSQLINGELSLSVEDVNSLARQAPILIDIDFSATDVTDILTMDIKGINLAGGEEEKVGLRSFDDVQDIMDALDEWA